MAGWSDKLKKRWNLHNTWQVVVILLVFTCTGFTVAAIKNPILRLFFPHSIPLWASVLYYVLILPVYNIFLLAYGFIFGQFKFFWEFEKRFFGRIFSRKKAQNRK